MNCEENNHIIWDFLVRGYLYVNELVKPNNEEMFLSSDHALPRFKYYQHIKGNCKNQRSILIYLDLMNQTSTGILFNQTQKMFLESGSQ